ncbi:unnamed protein product [Amoebophrya sp. A25]|nr:unnamed protein product [Amoebophrya sp. A25]|eukprot:GSA25T00006823001.1
MRFISYWFFTTNYLHLFLHHLFFMASSIGTRKMPSLSDQPAFVHFRHDGSHNTILQKAPSKSTTTTASSSSSAPQQPSLSQLEMVRVRQECAKDGNTDWAEVESCQDSKKRGWVLRDYLALPQLRRAAMDVPGTQIKDGDDVMFLKEVSVKNAVPSGEGDDEDEDGADQQAIIADGNGGVIAVPLASLAEESDDDDEDSEEEEDDEEDDEGGESSEEGDEFDENNPRRSHRLGAKVKKLLASEDPQLAALASLIDNEDEDDDADEVTLPSGTTRTGSTGALGGLSSSSSRTAPGAGASSSSSASGSSMMRNMKQGGKYGGASASSTSSSTSAHMLKGKGAANTLGKTGGPTSSSLSSMNGKGSKNFPGKEGKKGTSIKGKEQGGLPAQKGTTSASTSTTDNFKRLAKTTMQKTDIFETMPEKKKRKVDEEPEEDAGGLFSD